MSLNFNILTLFPEMFPGSLGSSLAGKALERGDWAYNAVNIRDFGHGTHRAVDDTPYGGGAGMVMRADCIEGALLSVHPELSSCDLIAGSQDKQEDPSGKPKDDKPKLIYLSPRGKPLKQAMVEELSQESDITLLCGRYEGVDQRVLDAYEFEEISIGDYVLSGGEPAALILMDACIRLLDGVMGNSETVREESFSEGAGGLLEYPHYTRPAEWTPKNGQALKVPDILRSGDHKAVAEWRKEESKNITRKIRPDLLS